MDGFSYFKLNDEKLYKTSISGITGFYNKRNKVKTFVFASEDDMIYLHIKGPSVTKVVSSITQRDYKPYHSNEYGLIIAMNMISMMMHIMNQTLMMTLLMIPLMMRLTIVIDGNQLPSFFLKSSKIYNFFNLINNLIIYFILFSF